MIQFLSLKVAAVTCTVARAQSLQCQAQLPRAEQTINVWQKCVRDKFGRNNGETPTHFPRVTAAHAQHTTHTRMDQRLRRVTCCGKTHAEKVSRTSAKSPEVKILRDGGHAPPHLHPHPEQQTHPPTDILFGGLRSNVGHRSHAEP